MSVEISMFPGYDPDAPVPPKDRLAYKVRRHNDFVRWLYDDLSKWSKTKFKRGESEKITPEQAHEFWGGLSILEWPNDLWTEEHFTDWLETINVRNRWPGLLTLACNLSIASRVSRPRSRILFISDAVNKFISPKLKLV